MEARLRPQKLPQVNEPAPATERCDLADGVVALAPGVAFLPASAALVVADAHLGYEDVVGGALPLWSTAEIVATLLIVVARTRAREIVFLGDIVHGARMSAGAMREIAGSLDLLRDVARVTLVAGNHEGRTRAFRVLGATVEEAERDGWLLVHGDRAARLERRALIGHLHPSLHLGSGATVPAFVACERLVVVPALTPYSPGLDLFSPDFATAVGAWAVDRRHLHVVAATAERLYPFGALTALRGAMHAKTAAASTRGRPFVRRHLRGD